MTAINHSLRKIIRQTLCLVLIFLLIGCRGAYQLNLYSQPSGASVQVGSKFQGQTPCKIKIPRNSVLIRDHLIDITYTLADGRRMTKTYDLRNYEPPSELLDYIAGVFILPGALLISLTATSEDDQYSPFDKEDDNKDDVKIRLIGLGLIGIGAIVYCVLGGDFSGTDGYDILETFDDVNDVATSGSH